MRREVRLLKKELSEENFKVFEKIEMKLGYSNIEKNTYKEIIEDLLSSILEAQKRNESLESVLGKDLDKFCNEVIESSKKPNYREIIIEIIYKIIAFFCIVILSIYLLNLMLGENNYYIIEKINRFKIEIKPFEFLLISSFGIISSIFMTIKMKYIFKRTIVNLIGALGLGIQLIIGIILNKLLVKESNILISINVIYVFIIFVLNYSINKLYNLKFLRNNRRDRKSTSWKSL